MEKELNKNKSISVNIDKYMFKEFKRLIEKYSQRKYSEFINDFFIYANFPDLVKIFEFYGYPNHYEVYNNSQHSTESHKINIKNYYDINFPESEIPSTYIKKLIIYVVAAEREFFKFFTFQGISYNIDNPDQWYYFYAISKKNGIEDFLKRNQLLVKDTKHFEEELKELDNKIYQERLKIFYADLKFENNLVHCFNECTLSEYLSKNINAKDTILHTIAINKNEYRERSIHDILQYDIEHFKVNIIILYKYMINNIAAKKQSHLTLMKCLTEEYKKYVEFYHDSIAFENFIYFLIFEDREIFRFFSNKKIRFKQKIPNDI